MSRFQRRHHVREGLRGNAAPDVLRQTKSASFAAVLRETLDHGLSLLRRATHRVHNLANQLSVISFGLTTLKSRSTTKRPDSKKPQ